MKKSINIWSFHGEWDLAQKFQLAKDAGFEGFEVDLSHDGALTTKTPDADVLEVRALAEKHGLALSGLASCLYWEYNPVSNQPQTRQAAVNILRQQIRIASLLGIDTLLVIPGYVGVDFIPDAEIVPYDLAYERATQFIRTVLPEAEKQGITLGIENVWNKFLLSPLEFASFIDQFDSEYVAAYFDVGNTLLTGYPEHWIDILASRIRRVHLKDYRRAVGSVDGFVDLLSGDVNWPAVMQSLRNNKYDGWVTAEMIPPVPFYRYQPDALINNASHAVSRILNL